MNRANFRSSGKQSGRSSMALLLIGTLLVLLGCKGAAATNYTVGGNWGWTLPNATNGLNYATEFENQKVGPQDNAVFTFDPTQHDLLIVSEQDFNSCNTTNPITSYTGTGGIETATVPLMFSEGDGYINVYFICGFPGHCEKGMKIKFDNFISVSQPVTAPAPSDSQPVTAPAPSPDLHSGVPALTVTRSVFALASLLTLVGSLVMC